ncbi:MAG: hypothetical protein E7040_04085 [Lentisphaerae bacterium]|nr:hypothetical protein [Lentisphaerota bacterium]
MKRHYCFSLVELLTVIVIASILMAIAVPAVSSMIRGSASTQAGRELMGRIKAAKSYAVSKQTPVAIVFYTTEVPSGATLSKNYACSAYRLCTVKYVEPTKDNGNWGGWVFQDWVSEWYFLPKGVAIGLPEQMTSSLPGDLSEKGSNTPENADSLFRTIGSSNGADSTKPEFFATGEKGSGVSPVYFCNLSDIYSGNNNPVVFRNAIVFNAKGMMEKPKNLTPAVNDGALLPDKAVIIPLRTAFIESNTVSVKGNSKEYIPLRVDPSGKTYFYDGFVSF